jgi:hypothetical protein
MPPKYPSKPKKYLERLNKKTAFRLMDAINNRECLNAYKNQWRRNKRRQNKMHGQEVGNGKN